MSCYFTNVVLLAIVRFLNTVTPLYHACCYIAIVIVLCQSCCQPFSWYSYHCHPLLTCPSFAIVILHYCCYTALPRYTLLTTSQLLGHCHAALPAMLTVSSMLFCHHRSAVHCWITLPLSGYFGPSYCFASVIWLNCCHMA